MATKLFPKFSQGLAQDPTTRRIWFGLATAHDFESHDGMTEENLYQQIFASHFGQLAIIFLWTSGNLFHVAWQGNFEQWVTDPIHVRPIAHAIWDPHFGQPAVEAFTRGGASGPVNIATSGVYQWWYTIGLRTNPDLYTGSVFLALLSGVFLFAGWLHLQPNFQPALSWFKDAESRLNHHLAGLFGVSSLAWTGHLVHVAIPESRGQHVGWDNFITVLPHPLELTPFWTGNWAAYAQNPDTSAHLFGTSGGSGDAILTFLGGFHPQTQSLWLTDMAHHHLAIAVIFIVAGHMYRTNFGIGHRMKAILDSHVPPGRHCHFSEKSELKTLFKRGNSNNGAFYRNLFFPGVNNLGSEKEAHFFSNFKASFLLDNPVPKLFLNFYFLIVASMFVALGQEPGRSKVIEGYVSLFPIFSQLNLSSLPGWEHSTNIMPMGPGLYAIFCVKNGKFYIGESNDLCSRLSNHWCDLTNRAHCCLELQSDWITFGSEHFIFACLCVGPEWNDKKVRISKETEIINANSDKVYNTIDKAKKEAHLYCRSVQWNVLTYPSVAAAARAHGLSETQVGRLIRDVRHPEWQNVIIDDSNNLAQHGIMVGMGSALPVQIDGKKYRSVREAAKHLKIDRGTVTRRIKDSAYPDYKFLS